MRNLKTHTVQKGESLYSIARKYNTTPKQLMELNQLHNTLIKEGELLIVGINTTNFKEEMSYDMFLKTHVGKGSLKVQVVIGSTYFPITGVKIEVYKIFEGKKKIFFSGITEESGMIDSILLPAPIKQKDYLNGAALYKIQAMHPNYEDILIDEVSIYDGIKSIQKIEMVPTEYILGKGKANGK